MFAVDLPKLRVSGFAVSLVIDIKQRPTYGFARPPCCFTFYKSCIFFEDVMPYKF